MHKGSLLGGTALRTFAAVGLVAGLSAPAYGQEVPAEEDPPVVLTSEPEIESGEDASTDSEAIVVTGSRTWNRQFPSRRSAERNSLRPAKRPLVTR
jgi:hypothetical protein